MAARQHARDRCASLPLCASSRTVPTTMRAAAIDHFGGPEVLSIDTLPGPEIDSMC
jgi:hypothetical protein